MVDGFSYNSSFPKILEGEIKPWPFLLWDLRFMPAFFSCVHTHVPMYSTETGFQMGEHISCRKDQKVWSEAARKKREEN